MAEDYATKSVWNADDERLKTLISYMRLAEDAILSWDNDEIYLNLDMVSLIMYGTLGSDELEKLEKAFLEIETMRRKPELQNPDHKDFKITSVELYNKLKDMYKQLNKLQVKHGLYFRKRKDARKAITN